jgi:hypothetical protein
MKKVDFYEFVGVIAPGALLLFGLSFIFPEIGTLIHGKDISFGDLGLFLILAYVAGHLVQAVGNAIEAIWWKCAGGLPTDWVRTGKHKLLAPQQTQKLPAKVREALKINCPDKLSDLDRQDWLCITHQAYAAIKKVGLSARADTFNGNYGMFRGVVAGLLILLVTDFYQSQTHNYKLYAVLAVAICLSLYRMHRFSVHYGRELFVQFLNVLPTDVAKPSKEKED